MYQGSINVERNIIVDENKIVFKVKTGEEGLKLRAYLKKVQKLSSRLIKGAALGGRLEIDNRRVKLNHIVKVGENISLNLIKEESQNIYHPKKWIYRWYMRIRT